LEEVGSIIIRVFVQILEKPPRRKTLTVQADFCKITDITPAITREKICFLAVQAGNVGSEQLFTFGGGLKGEAYYEKNSANHFSFVINNHFH
jgi:hypothetical protein